MQSPVPKKLVKPSAVGATAAGAPRIKRRWRRSGVVATREIRRLSNTTSKLLPNAPFERLVREIALAIDEHVRFTEGGLDAIHEAGENFIYETMVKADVARRHAKRRTMQLQDIRFAPYMTSNASELIHNGVLGKDLP